MVGVYSVKFLIGNCHRCIGIELWVGDIQGQVWKGKAYLERRLMAVEGHLERAYHRWIQRGELSIREQETTNK